MHATVDLNYNVRPFAQESRQEPLHETMAPIRCACESNILCTSRSANLAKCSLDKLLGVGNEGRRLADLRHGGGDEMRLHTLNVHTVRLELGTKSSGPLLQERLAARVSCQKRGRKEATERSHGENKTSLTLDHAGGDELGDTQGSHAVDHDDVVHLLLRGLDERYGDVVAQADVVDQYGDVEPIDKLSQLGVVGVLVQSKVHSKSLDGRLGSVLRGNVGREGIELGLGARDEDQVVPFGCK